MRDNLASLPGPLLLAAGTVALQGGVLVALAVVELAHFAPERATMGISTTIFFLLFGASLLLCAWGLARRSSWARSPVVLAQLIALGLAWNFRSGGTVVVSVVLSVVAVAALVGVLAPSSRAALEGQPGAGPDTP